MDLHRFGYSMIVTSQLQLRAYVITTRRRAVEEGDPGTESNSVNGPSEPCLRGARGPCTGPD